MEDDPTQGTLQDEQGDTTLLSFPFGDGWTVRARLDGSMNILGLAIVPTVEGSPPEGGLTSADLGEVRVSDIRQRLLTLVAVEAARWLREEGKPVPAEPELLAELRSPAGQRTIAFGVRRPSRSADPDRMDRLAVAALRYIEAFKRDPRRVLLEMKDEYERLGEPIAYSTARERVREARKAGFLVGGKRGRAGAMAGDKLTEWQHEHDERGK